MNDLFTVEQLETMSNRFAQANIGRFVASLKNCSVQELKGICNNSQFRENENLYNTILEVLYEAAEKLFQETLKALPEDKLKIFRQYVFWDKDCLYNAVQKI